MNEAISKDFLEAIFQQYLQDEKHLIFEDKGEVGDIAELGLICEEVGEAMTIIRKKQGKEWLAMECADIIIRTLNFTMRKGLNIEKGLQQSHIKNKNRHRIGLFIKGKENQTK